MQLFHLGAAVLLTATASASAIPQAPNLAKALLNAQKQSCQDPMYANQADSDPHTQWTSSGADKLWEALVYEYQQNTHKKYPSLSHYVAEALGDTSENFDCAIGAIDTNNGKNDCLDYRGQCVKGDMPAKHLILNSLSSVANFYGTFAQDLQVAEGKDLTSADDIADRFVTYKKPKMSAAEIVGFVADFLSLGAGQIVSKGIESAVGPMTKAIGKNGAAPDYISSQAANYYKNQMNNYKQMGNQMAFEVTNVAGQYAKEGKNLVEGAKSMITEASSFMKLIDSISNEWSRNFHGYSSKLFNGNLSADGTTADGVSDFATLSNMVKDGKFTRAVRPKNVVANAQKAMYAQLIPIALHQNDDVRPTLIVRPYACDDSKRAKEDYDFGNILFYPHGSKTWKNTAVTVKKYPNLCFFFLDANKAGAGLPQRFEQRKKILRVIEGMTHSEMTGDQSAVGGLTLEEFAQSIHEGFLKNGNKKGAFQIAKNVKPTDPTSLIDHEFSAPGLYNDYFNECGNYNPNSNIKKNKDMDELMENAEKAHDWKFADMKKGYPCIPGVKSQ